MALAAEFLFIRHVRLAMSFHKIEAHAVMEQPTGNEKQEETKATTTVGMV